MELKARTARSIADEEEMLELGADSPIESAQVYLKEDVDKTLAEKDKEIAEKDEIIDELKEHIDELQKATDSAWSKVNAIYDELRHQKYKRCLAMARWCESKVHHIRRTPLCDMDEHEGWQHDDEFWQRWHKRWLELAEKFKEAK